MKVHICSVKAKSEAGTVFRPFQQIFNMGVAECMRKYY